MLRLQGFEDCTSPDEEHGYEKIALYLAGDGKVTHAARQLESGQWTSKLGNWVDIEHHLDALNGPRYGDHRYYMMKCRPSAERI